jgi:hypothetical protein
LPAWAASGQVLYANEHYEGRVPGDELPYILGGRCVSRPSYRVLQRYQRAGNLVGMTLPDLEELYRAEGIKLSLDEEETHHASLHILEGGRSLECPLPGTAGYARLFGQEHPPYKAGSDLVKRVLAERRSSAPKLQ